MNILDFKKVEYKIKSFIQNINTLNSKNYLITYHEHYVDITISLHTPTSSKLWNKQTSLAIRTKKFNIKGIIFLVDSILLNTQILNRQKLEDLAKELLEKEF